MRLEPGKFEYFLVDGLKLPPQIVKPVFDKLHNINNFVEDLNSYPIIKESQNERINKPINNIIKFIKK